MDPRSILPRAEQHKAVRALLLLALAFAPASLDAQSAADTSRHELVVLIHGMGRSSRSMEPMRRSLDSAGYAVINIGYSSYCCGIPELAAAVRKELDAQRLPHHTRLHFVAHSLGNIIVRYMLTQPSPPAGVERVVMLAPPNQGARAADRWSGMIGWLLEPVDELRTNSAATVRGIPRVEGVEIGIIAGKHDWTVDVEETKLPEARAHIVADGTHSFLMRKDQVKRLTVTFLKSGTFDTTLVATP